MTAGLVIDGDTTAVVACSESGQIVRFDFLSGRTLATSKVGEFPYAIHKLSSGKLAVSNWGQASISILKDPGLRLIKTIPVGSHPTELLSLTPKGPLLVACSDADMISVIDLRSLKEVRRVDLHVAGSRIGGAQVRAMAINRNGNRLFVTLAAINAMAVFSVTRSDDTEPNLQLDGLIPVGEYPTAILYSSHAHAIYIADGRVPILGPSSPQSPDCKNNPECRHFRSSSGSKMDYVGYLRRGGLEMIGQATLAASRPRMQTLAQEVYGMRPKEPSGHTLQMIQYFSARLNPNRPIQHVVYVMKENRTYDQILGDMSEGNGDPELALFGEHVTPNEHALARQFGLFDNFYVNGDVSADGQLWTMGAQATDFIDQIWPSTYSGHIGLRGDIWDLIYGKDASDDQPIGVPAAGFLWGAAHRANITYRDYGIWCQPDPNDPKKSKTWVRDLAGHYDPNYDPDPYLLHDQEHMDEWEREFRTMKKTGEMPALTLLYLGSDHTHGTQPGAPTPRSLVASNDLAVGRLIEDLSHSRFWPSTAVFIVEDDAQDGPDHVDCHRSTFFLISPYLHLRHGDLEHGVASTVAVLKTIEQILGLDSLTYFDDRAPSLLGLFQKQANLEPFIHRPPQVPLNDMNTSNAPGAKESATLDFSHPDSAPDQELNRVIWQSVKGRNSEPPPPVYSVHAAESVRSRLN
jgi:hypothetical protein